MPLKDAKKIVVMGAGESGVGAALLAQKEGLEVWVTDKKEIKPSYKRQLTKQDIPFEMGKHTERKFFEADCIIKSPGIPGNVPLLEKVKAKGIEVISEIEFGYRYSSAPIVAITGSNGKTTTTQLIFHLLRQGGIKAKMAGNVGYSFAKALSEGSCDVYVLEVSSFQLDDVKAFRPNVGVLLNLSPDHLDRYNYDFKAYAAAKMNLVKEMTQDDSLVYFEGDPMLSELVGKQNYLFRKKSFGIAFKKEVEAWIKGNKLCWLPNGEMDFSKTRLLGTHNQLNCLAAIIVAKQLGLKDSQIEEGLVSFQPVPHRLEPLGEFEGITFINDSKATNIASVKFALEAMEKPTIWIVGGIDKGNDYSLLRELVEEKVKGIVVLGSGKEKIKKAFPSVVKMHANSMPIALKLAIEMAEENNTVLLSPACASFDLFQNFEDRGEQFKQAIYKWKDSIQ